MKTLRFALSLTMFANRITVHVLYNHTDLLQSEQSRLYILITSFLTRNRTLKSRQNIMQIIAVKNDVHYNSTFYNNKIVIYNYTSKVQVN